MERNQPLFASMILAHHNRQGQVQELEMQITPVKTPPVKTIRIASLPGWSQQRLYALAIQHGMVSRTTLFR
jgi:hypothetical protein